MSASEKVLDAIQLLTDSLVQKAGYDKTIQAQIISCEDATIGKYKCRYQDAIIYAYTNSADVIFNTGAYVYILVPGGDMKKEKTIIGTTQKLGINYISQAEGDQVYDIIGNNCITSDNKFYLNSNNKNYKYAIYQYGKTSDVNFDITALNQYIQQSSSLIIGGIFKTSIPPERQSRGHYGIAYNLRFLDNTSNQQVVRSYVIDEDNMVDNPYRLIYQTRQYQIFDIDGANFIRVQSIYIFNKDFPGADGEITDIKLSQGDIEITALELSGAVKMSESEISGVAISFYTPRGTFFTDSSISTDYKTITAQVRIKSKLASAAQNIPFYWGLENVGISPSSQYYNKYLGRGWKCLNDKNIIAEATEMTDPVVQWVPGNDTYTLTFDKATARDNKLKVAIVYDSSVITKTINIQNLNSNVPVLTIESSGGTKFYYDIGHPTLTCKVNGIQPNNYKYYWAYENNTGVFEELPVTTEQNNAYEDAVTALNNLRNEIAAGSKFAKAEAENLQNLEKAVKDFIFIQRVKGNKIYDVQINNITSLGIFKCSVYNDRDVYLGTTSITLTNSLEGENLYSLVINNGSAVFQYNENGVAPTSKSLDVPQQIQGLSFTIYDNLGQPVDPDILANQKNCKIRWQFPIKNTMLVQQQENEPNSGTDATQSYKYYDNKMNLVYGIAQKYDIKKQQNQIKLTVDYKEMNLTAETDFTFAKQGEPGTNGTEYLVKLIPNVRSGYDTPLWPMVTKAGDQYLLNYRLPTGQATDQGESIIGNNNYHQLFKAQLWHSGELVWEGFTGADAAIDGVTKPSLVHWDVLRNKYNSTTFDATAFEVEGGTGRIRYSGDHLQSAIDTPLANIIRCSITWQGKLYYATIPIITAWTASDNYRVSLRDYSGFRYAIYTTDGINPQYDSSHPFDFVCMEKINDIWEDISTISGEHEIEYTPMAIGNYLSTKDGAATNSNLLEILTSEVYRDGCTASQWRARPASRYDGACLNVAMCCIYKQNNQIVGRINIPIHYLLNKYGMANINEWDGNSVQINEQGGFILAPQMGAGQKDSNNNFTGVLMGEVRNAGKSKADIGLLGYSEGDRTFFLNSENGSALFGKSNQGQIIVDPKSGRALLYSGDFWNNYNQDGLPTNYNKTNEKGYGLLIDLTTPQIRYGNGNFSVDANGILRAQEAHITGDITANSLTLGDNVMIGINNIEDLDDLSSTYATKKDAIAETQIIYITKAASVTSVSKNTTWVTATGDVQNTWTLKRPTYNASYPNVFIAVQKKTVSGDISCTTPLKDDSLTIIDGGRITTGSIDASKVSVVKLNANNITSGTIGANYIKGGTLTLGGNNNVNGLLRLLDAASTEILKLDNSGINVSKGIINGPVIYSYGNNSTGSPVLQSVWIRLQDASIDFLESDLNNKDPSKASISASIKLDTGMLFRLVGSLGATPKYSFTSFGYSTDNDSFDDPTLLATLYRIRNSRTDSIASFGVKGAVVVPKVLEHSGFFWSEYWNSAGDGDATSSDGFEWHKPSGYIAGVNCTCNLYEHGALVQTSSSSSRRYKHDIQDISDEKLDPHRLLQLNVIQFVYNEDALLQYRDMANKTLPGFIAEEVDEIYPSATIHNDEGEIESWDERRIIPGMLALIQQQDKKIKNLESRLEKLEKILIIENK